MRRYENINGEKPVIEIKEHHIPGSEHIILKFKNNNKKVIPGLYEVAVFFNGELCYDTPITNDVLTSRNDPEVQRIVGMIQRLERMDIHYLHPEEHDFIQEEDHNA